MLNILVIVSGYSEIGLSLSITLLTTINNKIKYLRVTYLNDKHTPI